MAFSLAAALWMALHCSPVHGQTTTTRVWHYTLLEGSTLTHTCLICAPPDILYPMRGSFDLVLIEENPVVSRYALTNISFTATSSSVTNIVTGVGTFQIAGEVALRQEMVLQVEVNSNSLAFTNEQESVDVSFPLIRISLTQTQAGGFIFLMDLVAAPLREIWFSTTASFTSGNSTASGGPGDVLSSSGRVVKRNASLLQRLGMMPVVPHLNIDALDMGPGGEIFYSLDQGVFSETLGSIQHGDLLSDRGRIVRRNQDLMAAFGFTNNSPDVGLDAVMVKDDGEILFSITTSVSLPKSSVVLGRGDVLSDRGQIFKSNQQLLARFNPATNNDHGLDALYVWPGGEIWFSTEEGFESQFFGPIQAGDLLSDQGIIVYRNLELLSAFAPIEDLADFGLDGLFVVTDTTPPAPPPRFTGVTLDRPTGRIVVQWDGQGRVFQLEKADDVTGPYLPCDCIAPDASFTDSEAMNGRPRGFYRLRQW